MNKGNSVFWRNNERASALFYDLLARAEQDAYDDDFLMQLAAYREAGGDAAHADIFAAQYLLHHGDAENAVLCGERAYRHRPLNYEVLRILAKTYKELGRSLESISMQGYCFALYNKPDRFSLDLTESTLKEGLDRLSVALGFGTYAPIAKGRAYLKNARIAYRSDIFIGEHLPLTMPAGSERFWAAIYTENEFLSDKSYMLSDVRYSDWFAGCGYRDFVFDLQKARQISGSCHIDIPEEQSVILPIAGTECSQELQVQTGAVTRTAYLGKWAFSYFRLDAPTNLDSLVPYAVGSPIVTGHSPHRKKLVLNILADGLAWAVVRPHFSSQMPCISRFFSHGTIFDQHFSTSEHTFPALPAIETGCYPQHIQIFNTRSSYEIPPDYVTVSERMKALGYYCAAPMIGAGSTYGGALRGYDRLVSTGWKLPAWEACERAIGHMEAFGETDLFLFLHVTDVHPYDAKDFKFSTTVEALLPIEERLFQWNQPTASVRLPDDKIYQQQYWSGIRRIDRSIGFLLSYIEEHYAENDYIVNLYSDHGVSIFTRSADGQADIIGENATCAAWMMRGAGVPQGIISDELTSIVDIYPVLGHLCGFPVDSAIDGNLPAVFGGHEREAVYTMSIFPGQTYKLAVRNRTHSLRIQTKEPLNEEGTADFSEAISVIYPRGYEAQTGYEVDSPELRTFFYPRARQMVHELANNGEHWPSMRAAHADWFGEK